MGAAEKRVPDFAQRLAGNLTQVRDLLQGLVDQKQEEIRILEEKLLRLKHGGGK